MVQAENRVLLVLFVQMNAYWSVPGEGSGAGDLS